MTAIDLDQQLVELRSAADAYAARHQFIQDLTWPEGVRVAVNFTCDFDAMLLRRLLNVHGVKATIFTPGRICELYPEALRAVVESGHEIADHMWEHRVPKEPGSKRIIWRKPSPRSNGSPGAGRSARGAAIALRYSGNTGLFTAPSARPTSGRTTSTTRVVAIAF